MRVFYPVSLGLCLVLALTVEGLAPQAWMIPMMLALILIGGMPHGGLDLLVARGRVPLSTPLQVAGFLAGYLGLAGAVTLIWLIAPSVALAAFLLYAALHFGSDWIPGSGIAAIPAGLTLLAQPAIAAPEDTARLFSMLGAQGEILQLAMAWAGGLCAPLTLWILRREWMTILILAGLGGAALVLHPLAWFFVYFGGIHGPHHMRRVAVAHGLTGPELLRHWIAPALIAAGLVIAGAVALMASVSFDTAVMRAVFIGFAALTVPHMVLVDFAGRRPSPG